MMKSRLGTLGGLFCAVVMTAGCGSSAVNEDNADGDDGAGSPGTTAGAAGSAGTGVSGASSSGGSLSANAGSGGTPASGGASAAGAPASGGVPGACDPAEPLVCVDSTSIRGCTPDGVYETLTCREEVCEAGLRLTPGDCVTVDGQHGCDCGEPLNPTCFAGADALCVCFGDCTADDFFIAYLECDAETPGLAEIVLCFQSLITQNAMGEPEIDCAAAEMQCLPAETP